MNLRGARRHSVVIGWMLATLLAGCPHNPHRASPEARLERGAATAPAQAGAAQAADSEQARKPAPPKGGPLPPQRVVEPVRIDRTCMADTDCAIKDIGSCCGAFPSCVNRNSPADPAAVKAACEKTGQATQCSHRVLEQCACRQGQCVAAGKTPVGGRVDATPAPPDPAR